MTTLYRLVAIKTAKQAEALPIGTVAAPMHEDGPDFVYALVRREETYEPWCNSDGSHARDHGELDGFVALVPVEAEEEREDFGEYEPTGFVVLERTRLVTTWEDS